MLCSIPEEQRHQLVNCWYLMFSGCMYLSILMDRGRVQLAVSFDWDGACHNPTGCLQFYCDHVINQLAVHCTSSVLHVKLLSIKVRFKNRTVGW